MIYPFELVNFDYGGALLYPDRFRIDALEKFVHEQKPTDFLLLMTLNVREYDPSEINETQQRIRAEVGQLSSGNTEWIESYFHWINDGSNPLRQITHVLYLIKGLAEANHYRISWGAPTIYKGSRDTILIHYLVDFSFEPLASTKVVSDQSLIDILKVRPRMILSSKRLVIWKEVPPELSGNPPNGKIALN